jgi:hypothetical protein
MKIEVLGTGCYHCIKLETLILMFWMNGCPHCHVALENVLPPLQEKYGAQLETRLIEVVSTDDVKYLHTVAKSFGILPVMVLGLTGYIAILGAWMIKRWASGRQVALAALAVFGMALVGVVFSMDLTSLEPFVIQAVCLWCISSAGIMALILLLSSPPAVEALYQLKLHRQPARTVRKAYARKKT